MSFKNPMRPRVAMSDSPPQISNSQPTTTAASGSSVDAKETSPQKLAFSAKKLAYQALARVPGQIHPHRHHVSSPQLFPSSTNPQNNISDDPVAKISRSSPIIGFTQPSDTYREPRKGNVEGLASKGTVTGRRSTTTSDTLRPILKQNPHSSGEILLNSECSLQPASERKPDPRIIVSLLDAILDATQRVERHLNIHDLLGQHQLDQLDFEERAAIRATMKEGGKLELRGQRGELAVFNEPLRRASLYASTTMILGGREHELPILVASCVEELYRTGIYQSHLFRALPNRSRLFELIDIFDSEEQPPGSIIRPQNHPKHTTPLRSIGFGADTSLHLESTPDICALLSMYLSSIPEPIMTPPIFRALWDWCAIKEEEEESRTASGHGEFEPLRHQLSSSIPLSRSYTNPTETAYITKAQLVLHLLPSPNFSLLVYLLAFFSQVVLIREENGVGIEDLGKMFGGRVFGGEMIPRGQFRGGAQRHVSGGDGGAHGQGEVMMCWFLRRWGPISDGLFEVVEEARLGSLHSKGVPDRSGSASSGSEGSSEDGSGRFAISRISGRDSPYPYARGRRNTVGANGGQAVLQHGRGGTRPISFGYEYDKKLEMAGPAASHSTPRHRHERGEGVLKKGKRREVPAETDYVILSRSSSRLSSDVGSVDVPSHLVDDLGVCPPTALEERLLDISMPTLPNDTLPNPNETDYEHLSGLEARPTLAPAPGPNAEKARAIIKKLGDELRVSNNRLRTTTAEVFSLRSKCLALEGQVRELEQLLEARAGRKE